MKKLVDYNKTSLMNRQVNQFTRRFVTSLKRKPWNPGLMNFWSHTKSWLQTRIRIYLVHTEFLYAHACECFKPFLDFDIKTEIGFKVYSAPACQRRCKSKNNCMGFLFDDKAKRCRIYSALSQPKILPRFTIYGGKTCSAEAMEKCKIFK